MGRDALSTRIEAIDKKLAGTPINAEERSIFKVHELLLKVNEKAYKPVLLAIGPYNDHGKVGHEFMEEHKLRYLKQMLLRRNECSVKDYISALSYLEERARNCYAERISLKKDEFVEMMLLDGCFIIELFRKYEECNSGDKHDPIFQMSWMHNVIARDLLLFENQLPYFVLTKLFEMSASDQAPLPNASIHSVEHIVDSEQNNEITRLRSSVSNDQSGPTGLSDLAISFFSGSLPFQDWEVKPSIYYSTEKPLCRMHKAITPPLEKIVHEHDLKVGEIFKKEDFKHLLDLIHTMITLSVFDMQLDRAIELQDVGWKFGLIRRLASPLLAKMENIKKGSKKFMELVSIERNEDRKSKHCGAKFEMIEKFMRLPFLNKIENWKSIPNCREVKELEVVKSIPSATELKESGVKFKAAKQCCTFAINFSNGVLEISPLRIEDETETFLRNLIAFEQYSDPNNDSSYVTDYICFIDDLINSPKDVELLRRKGIIENWLGDDEVASTMVNKLGHHVTVSPSKSIYIETSTDLNKHCAKRLNVWMAKLRHIHFNSPWALLSVLAAILLLGLAITQTVFSIIH
ncbi:hypothetical protein F2P56_014971 [Juglans regia]|uniref:UPF0481 protein At3g47200-like n=2 Tax=Juglans regia TaxID=51240 RepID=A0A2I4DFJ9_JUGRE|nr:UPF0481 protein At3g47200-like [Juglans regia]XP_018805925.1 UPF0481 protein At3g47200-like [Juglans regia]XP_018805929.1 UPF0481 protein At3g47200-like [Juglans regia]KAF5464934.1 hypothetical protein F2P56_014971 [Juglans regia]